MADVEVKAAEGETKAAEGETKAVEGETVRKQGGGPKGRKGRKDGKKVKAPLFKTKPIGGEKNGGFRQVRIKKLPNYYPTTAFRKPRTNLKKAFSTHRRKLRKSITPGTVLILVAGRYRGRRVVFLKQLKSGLLLVTGPYLLNKVPFRRMNQIYVIATKTKVDISGVKIPRGISDGYFRRSKRREKKKDQGEIFETEKKKRYLSEKRRKYQSDVDKQILRVMQKHPDRKFLFRYMIAMFRLTNKVFPHKMNF